ncbi:ABC transporter ATP-binding protein [Microcella daejeonensis]|uniref:ABC-type quaternary amine transporter n=1 Tax=Microcella daejeonensis TaxID=2994971 RepID=A0A9E8MJM5_9MICO|nr:ABC transporter ATP-binding protein [Microcella daejeonensis]WAB80775.1 ABC transporter ATP-binding protein [Microcella daejeonensis]
MSASLRIDALTKTFEGASTPAVDAISFDVAPGECLAVLGPSGSGKSTVLRSIAGLDVPDSGRILVDGADVAGVAPERRGMAMVFQRPLLFPHLSVLDNVAFAATVAGQPRREARADAEQFLALVQLEGFGARPVTALSGGQEQRVALARALAARPRVLLLDEPFSALDPELRLDMHDLLARIRAQLNPTVVMVTHDRDEAATVADKVALLQGGHLLQHDAVERLYTRPRSLAVARLMGGRVEIPGTVAEGVHTSTLGRVPAPEGEQWPDGAGVLVLRHEAVQIISGDAPPCDDATITLDAVVAERRARGARAVLELVVGESPSTTALEAEVAASRAITAGQRVTALIPRSACAVVPLA